MKPLVILIVVVTLGTVLVSVGLLLIYCPDLLKLRALYTRQPFGAEATIEWPRDAERFRVLQIADTQVGAVVEGCRDVPQTPWPCGVANTTAFVQRLVERTRPHLVVFTGDMVMHPQKETKAVFDALLGPVRAAGVPFVVVFGNHDVEPCGQWTYTQTHTYMQTRALLTGTGLVTVTNNGANALSLWFFDYVYDRGADGYTAVHEAHVQWFSRRVSSTVGPSLAFAHVPLPEYHDWSPTLGEKYEGVYAPKRNTGLFDALRAGGVRALSVGHDHVNDYCAATDDGPTLCYAGGAGYTTYGRVGWPRRARVFDYYRNGTMVTFKHLDNAEFDAIDPTQLI